MLGFRFLSLLSPENRGQEAREAGLELAKTQAAGELDPLASQRIKPASRRIWKCWEHVDLARANLYLTHRLHAIHLRLRLSQLADDRQTHRVGQRMKISATVTLSILG